jgi:hypothetical protein
VDKEKRPVSSPTEQDLCELQPLEA